MFVGIFLVCEILAMLVAATKGVSLSLLFLPFLKGSVLHIIEFLFYPNHNPDWCRICNFPELDCF